MNDFKDDTFLARWLNDELSEEELTEFKKSPEYAAYKKIKAGSNLLDPASFDESEILSRIKQRSISAVPKKSARQLWVYSAAASILVLLSFGLYTIFFASDSTTYQTKVGEQLSVYLPDGSSVVLNANSTISLQEDEWDSERRLNLIGEAYFKVTKGSRFTVETEMGEVSVLGTQFTVLNREDFFEVKCYEGSVKVVSGAQEEILKPKKSARRIGRSQLIPRAINTSEPSWLSNRSSFESVPFQYVITELQNQYRVKVEGAEGLKDQVYSGGFPHNNLELALESVFGSAGVDFEIKGNVVVLSN